MGRLMVAFGLMSVSLLAVEPPDLSRVSVLGTNSVGIGSLSRVVSGDVVVGQTATGPTLDPGASLSLARQAQTVSGFTVYADKLRLQRHTRVGGDAVYNVLENQGTIAGEAVEGLALPVFDALPFFESTTPGTDAVSVPRQTATTLEPGAYGDLTIDQLSTVVLSAGAYDFRSISIARQAHLRAAGAVTIRVAGSLRLGQLSSIGPADGATITAKDVLVYVGGDASIGTLGQPGGVWTTASDTVVWFERQSRVNAGVYAPSGTIRFDQLVRATGAFLARDVWLERQVEVTLDYGFPPPVDEMAPELTIVEPALALYTDPTIANPVPNILVTFTDAGAGLDLSTLRIVLDDLGDPAGAQTVDLAVEECEITTTHAICPAPGLIETSFQILVEIADVAGNVATDEHTYAVDFTSDDAMPTVTISSPVQGQFVGANDVEVTGTVGDDTDNVLVLVNSEVASIDGSPLAGTTYIGNAMLMFEGVNPISVIASDAVGHATEIVEITVIKDTIPPVLTIVSPEPATFSATPQVVLSGSVEDTNAVTLEVDGVAQTLVEGAFETTLNVAEGRAFVTVVARDPAGNETAETLEIVHFTPPSVTITSPAALSRVDGATATVTGTVDEPVASVVVGGVLAQVTGTTFSASVALREGSNLISAVATDFAGASGVAAVEVFRDSEPPLLALIHPAPDTVVDRSDLTLVGTVRDISVAVGETPPTVLVNGEAAAIANRGFTSVLNLTPGPNVITVEATDAAGNATSQQRTVVFEPIVDRAQIATTSGDRQRAPVDAELPAPLIVTLLDRVGDPMAGETVLFRITEGDGRLNADSDDARGLAVATDAQGQASVRWTLGLRSGLASNRVEATAVGFAGRATFAAEAESGPPALILVDNGNYQLGATGETLAKPLTLVATDSAHNPLPGVPVTFSVVAGGGDLGTGAVRQIFTDDDGRASVFLTLGPEEGSDNNVIQAEVDGIGDGPRFFYASSLVPGDPALTTISGVVLDNTDRPVPGATVHIDGTSVTATSDSQGQFTVGPVPVGRVLLEVDADTTSLPGTWPSLGFERVTVAGRDNRLERPVYVLPLDIANGVAVSETTGATLTLPDLPGFALEIASGSATFADGTKAGTVAVTVVHNDKVPMLPSFGQQPLVAVTIQPADVVFDPPARLSMPNTCGLAPGAVTELFSFRHDQEQFVPVGTAAVTSDGSQVISTVGNGIVRGGWHLEPDIPRRPPRDPPGDGCHCKQCFRCARGNCVLADPPPSCNDGKFCTVNDKCTLTGGCTGEKRQLPNPISITIPLGEIKEGIQGPVRFFQFGGQCEITEGSFSGSMSGEKASKCCENLNAVKSATKISGSVRVSRAGFKCLIPGASINAGVFRAGVRAGLTWGIGVSASGGNDPCESGCDREFSASLSGAITGELVLETVGDVLELSAGISGGAAVTAKFGCGMNDFSGMLGPITVFGKAVLFGFVDVEIKEEVPNTKISR